LTDSERQELIAEYMAVRSRYYETLDRLRGEIGDWLEKHRVDTPSVVDLALFRGLYEERRAATNRFHAEEDRFMDRLLGQADE
jgi:hypothetical protein